ncbi:phage tail fiber protein [Methylobacterium frigidaeris]|uniref:Uncharacterized protein n=1 Tax=Methylobacterium frigidaeris TaxID=2038277 RepID=A0AA37HDE9_9HYPH|nr:hypothetical protein [Methylobacterium frigidaeris]PIK73670.1 hypothetical protein CS379_07125 [Methylobacterium frigidaeris]GJD63752.1 hypothetical protein MPEAHAMD_3923 [Methylobacterium frigidaeris]
MSITSANAVLMLGVNNVFSSPQQIQGFATDDAFDTEVQEIGETMMGVDGFLSGGFVYTPVSMGITLMADSPSTNFFDAWANAERVIRDKYTAFGTIFLQGTGRKYAMTKGFLISAPVLPDAKKVLQPRKFTIRWERVLPAPV